MVGCRDGRRGLLFILAVLFGGLTWCAASAGAAAATPVDKAPQLAAIEVTLTAQVEDQKRWIQMVKDLSLLKVGDPLTAERVAAAKAALTLSQRFDQIVLRVVPGPSGSIVNITARPFHRIRRIQIEGHYPLFESEVRQALPVHVGDRFDPALMPSVVTEVEALYRRLGYIAPKVEVKTHGDARGGRRLAIEIRKGTPYRLVNLRFSGNHAFSTHALKFKFAVWRDTLNPWQTPFSEYRLKQDIENLIAYYRLKHFADVHIGYTIEKPMEADAVSVVVNIEEGPRYTLIFDGNEHFWNLTLKRDLAIWQTGNESGRGVRKSIRQMQARYRRAGFADIRITPRIEASEGRKGYPLRQVRLLIDEGPRTRVRSIEINGNQALSDEEIRGQLLTRPPGSFHWGAFDQEIFDEDLFSLSSLYLQKGYLQAEISPELNYSPDRTQVDIVLRIAEGPKTEVSAVTVSGSRVLDKDAALGLLAMKPGEPFRRHMLQSDANLLAKQISEQGYPHVQVRSRLRYHANQTRVVVTYEIDDGPFVRLGNVYTGGYFKTRPKKIRKTLKTESGAPFSLTEMVAAQRDLRDMEIFEQVQLKTIGLKERADTVHVVIDAEEKPPYFFETGLGYETDTGFFGRSRLGDRNLFGLNKSGWIGGEVSEIGYHGELGLTEPRLFDTHIKAAVGAFVDREQNFNQDFGTHSYGTTLNLLYPWSDRISTSLATRYEYRDQFSRGGAIDPADVDDFKPRTILVNTPEVRYDSRDSFIRPRSGWLGRFSVDISKGLTNRRDDFLKYELDIRTYVTPFPRLTFAWRGYGGHLDPYGANRDVPEDQLFFLGGTNDVRGFEENLLLRNSDGDAVGGRNALFTSLEARIDLGGNFELTSFYDLGSLQDEDNRQGGDPVRSAIGLGLRYHTPIGPIGLLYGHKLDRRSGEDAGRLHFSIGYTF